MKVSIANEVNIPQKLCASTQDDTHANGFLLNGFVLTLFVNVCLDFSIAQYMEDWYLTYKKEFALSDKKRNHFTDKLECSINKKTSIKTIVKKAHKSSLTNGTRKSKHLSCYTNFSISRSYYMLLLDHIMFVKKS